MKTPPKKRPRRAAGAGEHHDFAELVRFSRAGDQFHYVWAARRLLRLLDPNSPLVAVAIEGVSKRESESAHVNAGEAVVDLAEYEKDERLLEAAGVRYVQLKYSTRRADLPWGAAGLAATIKGFFARFEAIESEHGTSVADKLTFEFITNRPIQAAVVETVKDLSSGASHRHPRTAQALTRHVGADGKLARRFWYAFRLVGAQGNYQEQQADLQHDVASYLAGLDIYAPLQLKELVVQCVLPKSTRGNVVRRMDVLRALGVSPDEIYPAPNRIEIPPDSVPRTQERVIGQEISASTSPVIIEAPSGVGKSVLAMRLRDSMPAGSATVVYDCFGAGEYRQRAHPRHRPKDALVQIGNELAAMGLCDPLLPSSSADTTAYFRALIHRLEQAVQTVKRTSADALVVLVVDAADNAEMGAHEAGDQHSFVVDMLRQALPKGARLVMLCRPERTHYLQAPPGVRRQTLEPFTLAETSTFLRQTYPEASDAEVEEFHYRSSHNPRVQANALAVGGGIAATLRGLGPNPKSVDDTIAEQLQRAVDEALDSWGGQDQEKVRRLCAALAILRPLIPIEVLASVSGTSPDAIRSFAVDFAGGRPIMVAGDAVQFRDEPVEDWFRKTFRPSRAAPTEFIERVKLLGASNAYAAAALPEMLLEAGRLDELIEMALSSTYLPAGNALQRRDVELQRLQFALRASLKARRYVDATKLALRVGEEAAGDSRHLDLIQNNTDIAGLLLDAATVQELVSRRGFKGKWLGARHAYEAALLSPSAQLSAEARSRARLAYDWLRSWAELPNDERRKQEVTTVEIAELAYSDLRLSGPKACLTQIARWRPPWIGYQVIRRVVSRLFDAGDFGVVRDLEAAIAVSPEFFSGLAIVDELARVGRVPSKSLTRVLLRHAPRRRVEDDKRYLGSAGAAQWLESMANLLAAAVKHRIGQRDRLLSRLEVQLPLEPPRAWNHLWGDGRQAYLAAYALRDALSGKTSTLAELAEPEIRKVLMEKGSSHSEDARRFTSLLTPVWPLARLRAVWHAAPPADGANARVALAEALKDSGSTSNLRQDERIHIEGEMATLWLELLALAPVDRHARADFTAWVEQPNRRLAPSVWTAMARLAARTDHLQDVAHDYCQRALRYEHDATEDVSSKIDAYIGVARALLALDRGEASAYLERAIQVASRVGDDAYDRWDCVLQLGDQASQQRPCRPDVAYRLGRCGEVIRSYLDKHFDWRASLKVMCRLSPECALAMASRWRDRNVGWFDEVLTGTLEPLADDGVADAREIAAFVGFAFGWNHSKLFESAMRTSRTPSERESIANWFVAYLRLLPTSSQTWGELEAAAKKCGFQDRHMPDMREAAEKVEAAAQTPSRSSSYQSADETWTSERWDALFATEVLEDATDFATIYERSDYSMRRRAGQDGFWAQAFQRVRPGREADFVALALDHPDMGPLEIDTFLSSIPPAWRARITVQGALENGMERLLVRHHTHIWHSRVYQRVSIPMVAEAAGKPVSWALEVIFQAFGSQGTPLASGEAFQLTSLLAMALSADEALDALSYALTLIEDVLRPEDGDGPWSSQLSPGAGVAKALAGLLWGCLGAPQAAVRWQAAHAVRRLCALEEGTVLNALVEFANGAPHEPFRDRRFVFYSLHARMWLLIALARAALEQPRLVARHADFVLGQVFATEPHVLMRHFAKFAATALHRSGALTIGAENLARLRDINQSPFALMVSDRYSSRRSGPPRRDWESRRFHIPFDMDRYWFEPLADVFDVTGDAAEQIAEGVVCDDWGVTSTGGWKEDARRTASVLTDDYTSHGSLPRVDNLDFYLSFHALMVTAGKLLVTHPAHTDIDEGPRFESWLKLHVLTRDDGAWLADVRDPIPLDTRDGTNGSQTDAWRWSVTADELRRGFELDTDEFAVWGHWSSGRSSGHRATGVSSALVSSKNASALLRALQTINNPRNFRLPHAGDDAEIPGPDFELKGWINIGRGGKEFDEYDPWSADIPYPPPRPSQFVVDALNVTPDAAGRTWHAGARASMRAEIWGSGHDHEGYADHEGDRLLIRKTELLRLLSILELDLMVEVQIEHRLRHSWHSDDDGVGYVYPYSRMFLLRRDGSIQTA